MQPELGPHFILPYLQLCQPRRNCAASESLPEQPLRQRRDQGGITINVLTKHSVGVVNSFESGNVIRLGTGDQRRLCFASRSGEAGQSGPLKMNFIPSHDRASPTKHAHNGLLICLQCHFKRSERLGGIRGSLW